MGAPVVLGRTDELWSMLYCFIPLQMCKSLIKGNTLKNCIFTGVPKGASWEMLVLASRKKNTETVHTKVKRKEGKNVEKLLAII